MTNELLPKEEWEAARSTALHFDTILMQIRTFGLPFIATAVGAGAALGTTVQRIDTSPWVVAALSISFGTILLLLLWTLQSKELSKIERLKAGPEEFIVLFALAGSFLAWGIWIAIEQPPPYLFSAPVLIFGALLLIPIYLLDRFYYSALLLGAIARARELEGGATSDRLSRVISDFAPDWAFKVLPMLFYALPLLLLLNIGLATIAFASESPASCEVTIATSIEEGEVRLVSELPAEVASECLN